jgi:hypothetical protein
VRFVTEPAGTPSGEPDRPPDPPPYPYPPPPARRGNGLGIASLAVGLVALPAVLTLFGGAILGIAAVMMGIVARRRVRRGEATGGGAEVAGIVLGLIAVVASAFVIWLVFGTELFNEDYHHCLDYHNGMEESCAQYR